jgi:N-acetylglucosaminyldiphosphoundecaprenol N-acetyl-beta-D-mannosaminyltransferase
MRKIKEFHFIKKNLLGIEIYDTTRIDLIKVLEIKLEQSERNILFGISAAAFGRLKYRPDLLGLYKNMDILIAEGAGLPLFARSFGIKISEKIGLVNVIYDLLYLANRKKYRVLFFGATSYVNKLVIERVKKEYPNIHICKGINGYFQESEVAFIVDQINIERPDILFIGITYPLKERFAVKFKNKLDVKLIVPCGGAFDVIAGKTKKNKEYFKFIPTAWLNRFLQEPRRLFKPIIVTMVYSFFIMYPNLLARHLLIRRNPSIGEYFNLSGDEWDIINGKIKEN